MTRAYLELSDIEKLEQAAAWIRDRLLIRLLFRLAGRISEVLGIEVDDINFEQSTIRIQRLKVRMKLSCPECGSRLSKTAKYCTDCGVKVEKVVAEEKEHRRVRTLPIDAETLAMLKDYIDRGGAVSVNGKTLLFGMSRSQAWKIVSDLAHKARLGELVNPETGKVRGVSPHRLRDAFATMAVKLDDSGDGLRMLQEMLGHDSIVSTMKYRKVAGKELREWYDQLLDGGAGSG